MTQGSARLSPSGDGSNMKGGREKTVVKLQSGGLKRKEVGTKEIRRRERRYFRSAQNKNEGAKMVKLKCKTENVTAGKLVNMN